MERSRVYAATTALVAGVAAALAHPPFGLLPGLLGFSLLLIRLEGVAGRSRRSAFGIGWLAGVGYFAVSTFWIAEPFFVDVRIHGWMAPFAVVFMAGGLALFWGAAGLAYRWARPRGGWKPLVFAGLFAGAEWLRGHILTGLPWNLVGETWRAGGAPSQAASVVGAYGLTWITLAVAAAPAVLMLPARRTSQAAVLTLAGVMLTALYAGGAGRLAAAVRTAPASDAPLIRIVQADIDQKEKWRPENLEGVFNDYVALTARPAARTPDVVIWPEGALPAMIEDVAGAGAPLAPRLRDAVAPGQTLLMGANRQAPSQEGWRYFNTLIAFRRDGPALEVAGVYDKHKLVPFGEFMPLGDLADALGFRSLVRMPEDFTPGPRPRTLSLPGLPPVQPLICYEALFPNLSIGPRPAWILNVSNDAWFGQATGPWQHLNIAAYRAIEEGLPMIRSTPTGVSAVIDAHGRVIRSLGMNKAGVIDAPLPSPAPPTLYSRWGDAPLALMLLISAGGWLLGRRRTGDPGRLGIT